MPRPPRIEFPGAWYLVKNRGYQDRKIFQNDGDRQLFLRLAGEAVRIFSLRVHAYVLLDRRYTLIAHTPNGELARAMRHLNGVYTQEFNRLHASDGPVFAGRYQATLFDAKKYLIDCVSLIHQQPVTMGLCERAADYPWSSHRFYLQEKDKPAWLHVDETLRAFGFLRFLAQSRLDRRVAGDFPDEIKQLLDRNIPVLGEPPLAQNKPVPHKEERVGVAREILEFVSHAYNVPVSHIKKSRSGIANEARSMAVYQLRHAAGLPQRDIARLVSSKSGYTVAKTLERFHTRLTQNEELLQKTSRMTQTIQARVRQ